MLDEHYNRSKLVWECLSYDIFTYILMDLT